MELAEGFSEVKIKAKALTGWVNRVICKDVHLNGLHELDGQIFIKLVKSLEGPRTQDCNKAQSLNDVPTCLQFLKEKVRMDTCNTVSTDIIDGKLEKILELLSSLMLQYAIVKPLWAGDRVRIDISGKQKLLEWIQKKIPEKRILNFTSDWSDGTAIGALVDALIPGVCSEWQSWDPSNNVYNATQAMAAAYKWTGIPQLIDPCDMCSPALDEISTMTYLSQFPNNKPIIFPAMVNVHGPGIEPFCNTIGNPARFVVETKTAGEGEPDVFVTDPDGKGVHCERKSSNCVFVPLKTGIHQIKVLFAGIETPRSPYLVNVDQMPGHAENVTATGPGLEKLDDVLKKNHFEVLTKNAGIGVVDVGIIDARGLFLESHVTRVSQDVWQVEYSHKVKGRHSIYIFYAGNAIPNSPFHVGEVKKIPHSRSCTPLDAARLSIASQIPSSRVRKVEVKGLNNRVPVGEEVDFNIEITGEVKGRAQVLLTRPSGMVIAADIRENINGFGAKFTPIEEGPHQIKVVYAGQVVPQSTFQCEAYIDPNYVPDMRLIICFGPGLHPDGVFLGSNIDFQVNTKNIRPIGQGEVRASITAPSGWRTKVSTIDNKDGTFNCSCKPEEEGPHVIYVVYRGLPVPKSPFRVNVRAGCDPSKVKAYGPGLGMALLHEPQFFIVETKGAGRGEIAVEIDGPAKVAVQYEDDGDGRIIVRYEPTMIGGYDIIIKIAERQIQGSPFKVFCTEDANPENVRCSGTGIAPIGTRKGQYTYFTVDASHAGPGILEVMTIDCEGRRTPLKATQTSADGVNVIIWQSNTEGPLKVDVKYAGVPVPGSPFQTRVLPSFHLYRVRIHHRTSSFVSTGVPITFTINTGKTSALIPDVIIKDPSHNSVKHSVTRRNAGVYEVSYTPEWMGKYQLFVQFEGQDVPNTPITTDVNVDARRVKILGKVNPVAYVGMESVIRLNTADAGRGYVTCDITTGSIEVTNHVSLPDDGRNVTVSYKPISVGPHNITLKFDGQPIPGGQFVQYAVKCAL